MGESNDASAFLDAAFQPETDRLTRTTVREGNAVTFMPRGEQSYERRWQLIQDAKRTVHLVTFSVINDDTTVGWSTSWPRRGAKAWRSRSSATMPPCTPPGRADFLIRCGPLEQRSSATTHPFGIWAWTSGGNTSSVRFLGSLLYYRAREEEWRRRRERGFDPGVVFERAIEETSLIEERRPGCFPPLAHTGGMALRYVGHNPYDEEELPLTNAFVQAIRAARRSIWWGCHGVRPPRILAETLADAAARGVEVRLISNSKASSRSLMGRGLLGWMYWECSNHFRWLIERGIHMHLWQRPGAFHSKNFLVDDQVCAIGSYNIANGSAFHHTESAIFAYGGPLPQQVRRQFEIDFRDCHELTLEETRRPWSWADPFHRGLHERNLLVDRALWPSALAADLDVGRFKWKYGVAPDW